MSTITDLTGTTWYFNETITIPTSAGSSFRVNFTLPDYSTATGTSMATMLGSEWMYTLAVGVDPGMPYIVYQNSAWTKSYYRTVTFTGGTDVANANLISFMQANATQIMSTERTISLSVTNGTITEFSHELTPDTGYTLPSSVTVTGASSTYSGGVVTLTNLTSSVSETAEASQGGSGSLTVTYNSSDIIDTTSDGTYTLPCSGKIMNSDIVISAENVTSLTVTYNNTNIINASNDTHTYTLSCNGKYMNSDVGISVTIGGGSVVVLHEQEGSTIYLYGAYTKTQSGSVLTLT